MSTELHPKVLAYFSGDKERAELWMRMPNPLLGGITPGQMVEFGLEEKLNEFIKRAMP